MLAAGGFIFIPLLASISIAAPTSTGIVPLTPSQVSSYKPFTHFASATYCGPNATINWSCGGTSFLWFWNWAGHQFDIIFMALTTADCKANSDFIPVASGGNGDSVQFCKRFSLNSFFLVHSNDETMLSMLKGMLASHHHKARSSSLTKEPIFLKCWFNSCTALIKGWICV